MTTKTLQRILKRLGYIESKLDRMEMTLAILSSQKNKLKRHAQVIKDLVGNALDVREEDEEELDQIDDLDP